MAFARASRFHCGVCGFACAVAMVCAARFVASEMAVAAPVPPKRPGDLASIAAPPLPPPRPPDLPLAKAAPARLAMLTPPHAPVAPALPSPPSAPESHEDAAACDALLSGGAVVATRLPAISGETGCGIAAPVSLAAVILPDKRNIPIEPHPTLRCDLAAEAAHWLTEDLIPSIEVRGRRVVRLVGAGGYECRSRNRQVGGPLSEHARGNAFDLVGAVLANGQVLPLSGMSALEAATDMRTTACARFSTVLGPGSDGAHENHVHLDLEPRRNGGRICHWDLR